MPDEAATTDWSSISMSSEAKDFYENNFLPRYKELLRTIKATPLCILVWGPGKSGGDLYEKRLQIRGKLRALGLTAIFSEEIDTEADTIGLSAKAQELIQALVADFIVIIQSSPGSTAEVHDFAEFIGEIGRKMIIFIDERARDGYSYTGALQELRILYNNVETYNYPSDITDCHLLGKIQKKIEVLQAAKWRAGLKSY